MVRLQLVVFALVWAVCSGTRYRAATPGPWVIPTTGEPWPKPQRLVNYEGYVVVRPSRFTFEVWKLFIVASLIICAVHDHCYEAYAKRKRDWLGM
jgi:hypothetical protein